MSLLTLYANIVWRGNGPGAICKRKVAASLVSLNNAPQSLVDLLRRSPALIGTDGGLDAAALHRILAAEPCFLMLDSNTVRLDVELLLSMARSRLVEWVDAVFSVHTGPSAYLKGCLAKYIITEQDASVNASPSSLFAIPWSSAETILNAYWSDEHPWSGTVSPTYNGAEALFVGDSLWSVQPGVSIKLNVAAVVHRASSLQAVTETGDANADLADRGDAGFYDERPTDSIAAPVPTPIPMPIPIPVPAAASVRENSGQELRSSEPPAGGGPLQPRPPPPNLRPSAALFAAAALDPMSRATTSSVPKLTHATQGEAGLGNKEPTSAAAAHGNSHFTHLDLAHGFNLGLQWPVTEVPSRDHDVHGVRGVAGGEQAPHRLSPSSLYDPSDAAVEEVAEYVALDALADGRMEMDRAPTTGKLEGAADVCVGARLAPAPAVARGAEDRAIFASAASEAAVLTAAMAEPAPKKDRAAAPAGLYGRGWELFPSMNAAGTGVRRGGGSGGGDASAVAGGKHGNGNMSLLDELFTAFVPSAGGGSGANSATPSMGRPSFGEPDVAAVPRPQGGRGTGGTIGASAVSSNLWGISWSSTNAANDGLQRAAACPPLGGGGGSGLLGGGGRSANASNVPTTPPFLFGGIGLQPPSNNRAPADASHLSLVDAKADASGAGEGRALGKLHLQSEPQTINSWRDPAILNPGSSGHRANLTGPGLGGSAAAAGLSQTAPDPAGRDGDGAGRVAPKDVPFPPPPMARGALAALAPGAPLAMFPAAALHGFDVAAATGLSVAGTLGSVPPVSLAEGGPPAAVQASTGGSGGGTGLLLSNLSQSSPQLQPQFQQPKSAYFLLGPTSSGRREGTQQLGVSVTAMANATAASDGRSGGSPAISAGPGPEGPNSAQTYSALAARVWADDSPQDKVRRIAATLLALSGSPRGASGPYSMALELLLLAVRRQDPVACNKAGNLLSVLEGDPCKCLSVAEDSSGGEIAFLDLSKMLALAGLAPGAAVPAASGMMRAQPVSHVLQPHAPAPSKRPSYGDAAGAPHPMRMQPSGMGVSATASEDPDAQSVGPQLTPRGWPASRTSQLQTSSGPVTQAGAPTAGGGAWLAGLAGVGGVLGTAAAPPPPHTLAEVASPQATAAQQPQQQAYAANAAAMHALKAAQGQQQQAMMLGAAPAVSIPSSSVGATTAPATAANASLLLQFLQKQQQQQQHLSQAAVMSPMLASGVQHIPSPADTAMLLQLYHAQQAQAKQQLQAVQRLQQSQQQAAQLQHLQMQQLQMVLQRQSDVSAVQQQQQLLQKQQQAQLQLQMQQQAQQQLQMQQQVQQQLQMQQQVQQQLQKQHLAHLRQQQAQAQDQAQVQLAPRLTLLPAPATSQASAIATLLQQYNANSAAAAAAAAAARVATAGNIPLAAITPAGTVAPPLTLASLSNVGGLPVSGGPVAQSQSHANVAAWLAAQTHSPTGTPPPVPGASESHGGAGSAVGGVGPENGGPITEQQQQPNMLLASVLREADSHLASQQQKQQRKQQQPQQQQPPALPPQQQLFELLTRQLQRQQHHHQNTGGGTGGGAAAAAAAPAAAPALAGGRRTSRSSLGAAGREADVTNDHAAAATVAGGNDLRVEESLERARRALTSMGSMQERQELGFDLPQQQIISSQDGADASSLVPAHVPLQPQSAMVATGSAGDGRAQICVAVPLHDAVSTPSVTQVAVNGGTAASSVADATVEAREEVIGGEPAAGMLPTASPDFDQDGSSKAGGVKGAAEDEAGPQVFVRADHEDDPQLAQLAWHPGAMADVSIPVSALAAAAATNGESLPILVSSPLAAVTQAEAQPSSIPPKGSPELPAAAVDAVAATSGRHAAANPAVERTLSRHVQLSRPTQMQAAVSPEHLLRAFPGLDVRTQALRTVAQTLLHTRHPQLGAAAANPSLLLLVLRQKGITGAALGAAELELEALTALLLNEPNFFRVIAMPAGNAPADAAAATAGAVLGGSSDGSGLAVQLKLDALLALVPQPVVEELSAEPLSASAELRNQQQSEPVDDGLGDSSADMAPVAVGYTALEAVPAAAQDVAAAATGSASIPVEKLRAAVEGAEDAVRSSGGRSSGSGSGRDGGGEGDDEQSEDGHVAMLMRLLATGARLEEEPLPDSEAKLQLQLSPLLGTEASLLLPRPPSSSLSPQRVALAAAAASFAGSPQLAAYHFPAPTKGSPVTATTAAAAAAAALQPLLEAAEEASLPKPPSPLLPRLQEQLAQPEQIPLSSSLDWVAQDADTAVPPGSAAAVRSLEPAPPRPPLSSPLPQPPAAAAVTSSCSPSVERCSGSGGADESVRDWVLTGPWDGAETTIVLENAAEAVSDVAAPAGSRAKQAEFTATDMADSLSAVVDALVEMAAATAAEGYVEVAVAAAAATTAGEKEGGEDFAPTTNGMVAATAMPLPELSAGVSEPHFGLRPSAITTPATTAASAVAADLVLSCDASSASQAEYMGAAGGSLDGDAAETAAAETEEVHNPGSATAAADAAVESRACAGGEALACHAASTVPSIRTAAIGTTLLPPPPPHLIMPRADAGAATSVAVAADSEAVPGIGDGATVHVHFYHDEAVAAAPPGAAAAAAAAATVASQGASPSAAHLQPAAVRYINALDVDAGLAEEVAALAGMAQHCAAAGRVVVDCAVTDLDPSLETAPLEPSAAAVAAAAANAVAEPEPSNSSVVAAAASDVMSTNAATASAAMPQARAAATAAAAHRRCSPVLLMVLAPAVAQVWPTTLYVLGVAGVGSESVLVRAAVSLLTGAAATAVAASAATADAVVATGAAAAAAVAAAAGLGAGGQIVKVLWNARQVVPLLSPLLPPGLQVWPTQDLQVLVGLASAGAGTATAAAIGSDESGAATDAALAPQMGVGAGLGVVPPVTMGWSTVATPTAASPSTSRPPHRPWSGTVPLQERLAQLGVSGRDLASLAALSADAWVVHPLSCVVEAAAARQLCQVLDVRRALLFGDEALLDALLCGICRVMTATA